MSTFKLTTKVLAIGLAEAVAKDELPENGGFDLSAGMFGLHVSNWLRSVAAQIDPPEEGDVVFVDSLTTPK